MPNNPTAAATDHPAMGALVDPDRIRPARRRERARHKLRAAVIEAQRAGVSQQDIEDAVRPIWTQDDAALIDARVRAEQEPREVTIRWDDGGHEPSFRELTLRLWADGRVTWK